MKADLFLSSPGWEGPIRCPPLPTPVPNALQWGEQLPHSTLPLQTGLRGVRVCICVYMGGWESRLVQLSILRGKTRGHLAWTAKGQ